LSGIIGLAMGLSVKEKMKIHWKERQISH